MSDETLAVVAGPTVLVGVVDESGVIVTMPSGIPGPRGPAGPAGPPGINAYEYNLSTSETVPPAVGYAETDTDLASNSTWLYLAHTDANGAVIAILLNSIKAGDVITVQDKADAASHARYLVTGDPVDNARSLPPGDSYVSVPVSYVEGTILGGKNNQRVLIFHQHAT